MLIKLLSQIIVAGMLFQLVPADAGQIEQLATLPDAPKSSFDLFEAYTGIYHLPVASDVEVAPTRLDPNSIGVVTSAQSAIVIDRGSDKVLYEKNSITPRSIGSITKLMTAYVFLESGVDLEDPAVITSADYRSGGRLHISLNDQVTVKDLLTASLVASDNSATASLVRISGLSHGSFVARMNEVAAQMGMTQTRFADETGLSSKNRSVVQDIAIMLDKMREQDLIGQITQLETTTVTGASGTTYLLESTDDLLSTFVNEDPYDILLAKTGFLPEAGYCLGTVFSYDNNQEIIVVVLGSESKDGRFQDVKSLAVWTYKTFSWEKTL